MNNASIDKTSSTSVLTCGSTAGRNDLGFLNKKVWVAGGGRGWAAEGGLLVLCLGVEINFRRRLTVSVTACVKQPAIVQTGT